MTEEYLLTQENLLQKLKSQSYMQQWDAVCSYELGQFNAVLAQNAEISTITAAKTFLANSVTGKKIVTLLAWPVLSFRKEDAGQFCDIRFTALQVSEKVGETMILCPDITWQFELSVPVTQILGTTDMTQVSDNEETLYFRQDDDAAAQMLLIFKDIDACALGATTNGTAAADEELLEAARKYFHTTITRLILGFKRDTPAFQPKEFLIALQADEAHINTSVSLYFQLEGSQKRGREEDLAMDCCPFPESKTASLMLDRDWLVSQLLIKGMEANGFTVSEEVLEDGIRITCTKADSLKISSREEGGFMWHNTYSAFEMENKYVLLLQNGEIKLNFHAHADTTECSSAGVSGGANKGDVEVNAELLLQGILGAADQFIFQAALTDEQISVSGSMSTSYQQAVRSVLRGQPGLCVTLDASGLTGLFGAKEHGRMTFDEGAILYAPQDFIAFADLR